MHLRRIVAAGAMALAIGGVGLVGSAAATPAPKPTNPQATAKATTALKAVAPDKCFLYQQTGADGTQRLRKTYNAPVTYTADTFTVNCSSLMFTVPRGKTALVDLRASGELDCAGGTSSWCEAHWVINGVPVTNPNNDGRGDTYAWDSGQGGSGDWSAHALNSEYSVTCPEATSTAPCSYTASLSASLANGATSWWIDDLTVSADVTLGDVKLGSVSPTS